jgi:release factor glutamine methyltransferase
VTSWRTLLDEAAASLDGRVPAPNVDARRIVEEAGDQRGGALFLVASQPAPPLVTRRVRGMVARRAAGEPLQYVLGSWSFLDLDLFVDPRVLIPRPETERTVEVALAEAARLGLRRGRRDPWLGTEATSLVADLGTGSGAIALALATHLPDVEVWATDRDDAALAVARANASGTGGAATRVRLAAGDWFDALPDCTRGRFRLVVSNPPYVSESELADLPPEVTRYEPIGALVSGPTGLEAITRVVAGAPTVLVPGGGTLVVEVAPHQAGAARELAAGAGFDDVRVEADLTGRDRVLVARGG